MLSEVTGGNRWEGSNEIEYIFGDYSWDAIVVSCDKYFKIKLISESKT